MMLTLKSAADYMRGVRVPGLAALLNAARLVFNFTQERANRLRRYVAIVAAYKRGQPVRDIEAKYGCSRSTVLRYARFAGLPKRPKSFDPELRYKVLGLYRDKVPIAEISTRLGVSQAYISKTATEAGINRRTFTRARRPQKREIRPCP